MYTKSPWKQSAGRYTIKTTHIAKKSLSEVYAQSTHLLTKYIHRTGKLCPASAPLGPIGLIE